MAREIWPYRKAPDSSLDFQGWMLSGSGSPEPLPNYLEGWDPLTDVLIERRILCDVAALRIATGLPEPIPLVISVSWMNQQSYMTEGLYREQLSTEQIIRVTLPSSRLGGSVRLVTSICVATGDQTRPLGTARWAGSILASDEHFLVLEGDGPMFPIAAVDFATTRYSAAASWAIQLPEDLTLPVLGSVLLLVNTRDKELGAALAAAKPAPEQSALANELETSIGAHLIAESLSRRDELDSQDWPEQSVGWLLDQYLILAEDQKVPDAIATGDPAMATAALIGAARSGGFGRRLG